MTPSEVLRAMIGPLRPAAALLAAAGVALSPPGPAHAQGGLWATAHGGIAPYDLSGTGTAGVAGLSLGWEARSFLVLEPGARYLRYTSQRGRAITYV